jgi:hypothetical protein
MREPQGFSWARRHHHIFRCDCRVGSFGPKTDNRNSRDLISRIRARGARASHARPRSAGLSSSKTIAEQSSVSVDKLKCLWRAKKDYRTSRLRRPPHVLFVNSASASTASRLASILIPFDKLRCARKP